MDYFYGWIAILLASLLGSMIPGLSFALVLRNTTKATRKTGIWTVLGLALGMSVHACIVVLGLSMIILKNAYLAEIIRWGGALYLAYMGIICLCAKPKLMNTHHVTEKNKIFSAKKALLTGFLTNVLNPKVILFFLALFTQFVTPGMPLFITWIYGLSVVFIEFCWFSLVAVILTHPFLQKRFSACSHWIERLSGVILLFISVHLAMNVII